VPTARRPGFPGYGITEEPEGLLPWEWATERLEQARNYWVSTSRADGSPHAMPVWGIWVNDAFVFGTGGRKRKNLEHDPRVVVHLESGDEVVVLEGTAELLVVTDALSQTYNAKYRFGLDPGSDAWIVHPRLAYAWRERDYPQSATRFDF
jgi:Pyridoxamine 5'-phosphate oxidase